jgi:hypothetical protein
VDGATGPAGPTVVSTDAGNTATLGTDTFIFVPAAAAAGPTPFPSTYDEEKAWALAGSTP